MQSSVFNVKAKENSISGGTPLNTGIALKPGQLLHIAVDPNQHWSAGANDRVSNANGLSNPLGGHYGFHTHGAQSFLFGSLVGSLDGGRSYFGVGTNLTMTILTQGTLTLHYWDVNNADNSGMVQAQVNIYGGPTNVNPVAPPPPQ